MKRFVFFVYATLVSLIVWADNTVSLSTSSGHPGDVVDVVVSLTNTDAIVAAEIKIPLNEHVTYVDNSISMSSARANGHLISASVSNDALNIYIYGLANDALIGNSGELCSFKVELGSEPSNYVLTPTVVLSNAASQAVTSSVVSGNVTLLSPKLLFGSSTIDFGHNPIRSTYSRTLTIQNVGTEVLNVRDVVPSVPELTVSTTNLSIPAGSSKSVTVSYTPTVHGTISEGITVVSDAINGDQVANVKADPYSVNILSVRGSTGISDSEATVSLSMNNMEPIVGVQCTFNLPAALKYVEGSMNVADRASGLTPIASVDGQKVTLYLYSTGNASIAEGNGDIATFKVQLDGRSGTYSLTPTDVVLSNASMQNMMSSTNGAGVVIQSPAISCVSSFNMGSQDVTQVAKSSFVINNTGRVPLEISNVTFLAEGYSIDEELPVTIPSSGSKALTVQYNGTASGNFSAVMQIYSNDPDNRLKSVNVSGTLFEPNYVALTGQEQADGTAALSVSLSNYSELVALQMDLHSDTPFTTSSSDIVSTNRLNGLSVSAIKISDNNYRLVLFSFNNKAIEGNDGEIFTIALHPISPALGGSTVTIDNIMLSNTKSVNVTSVNSVSSVICRRYAIGVQTGWNWVSHIIASAQQQDAFLVEGVRRVQTQDKEVVLDPVFGFVGNIGNVDAATMLKVNASKDAEIVLEGDIFEPSRTSISLVKGWNWLGYPINKNMYIEDALSLLNAEENDCIVGQDGYAMFSNGVWKGDLDALMTGAGYMYLSASAKDFKYSTDGDDVINLGARARNMAQQGNWTVDVHKYRDVMCLTADLYINNAKADAGRFTIVALHNGECRGISTNVDGTYCMSIHGDEQVPLELVAIDNETGEQCNVGESLLFSSSIVGTFAQPYTLHNAETTVVRSICTEDGMHDIYTIDGRQIPTMRRGVNILRHADGTVTKVIQ